MQVQLGSGLGDGDGDGEADDGVEKKVAKELEGEGEGELPLPQGHRPQVSWQYGAIHASLHLPQSFCWVHVQPPGGLTSLQPV